MRRRTRRHTLTLALALSAVLHGLAFLILSAGEGRAVVPQEAPIEVALIEQPPPPMREPPPPAPAPEPQQPAPQVVPPLEKPQLVSPPAQMNDQVPEHTRFESDRDNVVVKETVKKGVPNPGPPVPPPRDKPKPAARAEKAKPAAPELEDLFASTDELVRAQQGDRAREEAQKAADAAKDNRKVSLALAPAVPEWSLPGSSGTFDHLPDIQRGDVTLLNTKANAFAPFVRRVGERVFQHLIIRQRRLELEQILSARGAAQIRVILDKAGRLKTVTIEAQSGSGSMDETLSEAVNTAAFDNNPPPAAANKGGDFEFVFQAQLRAFEPGPGGRPNRIESRLSVALL
jgi:hypothetical protein